METVKSSEALESQILEDARAKARRILESADRECAAIRADWDRKAAEEARKLDAAGAARMEAMRQELASSLPLENMRARLSFIQKAVSDAMKELFDALSPADLARIIGGQLARVAAPFKGDTVTAWASDIDAEAARKIINESLPETRVAEVKRLPAEAAEESGKGLILESTDGSKRFRGTLNEVAALLLEDDREELVTALFGKDVHT
jgi:V/A-type H+/Na+-transporting ATPase subunit E